MKIIKNTILTVANIILYATNNASLILLIEHMINAGYISSANEVFDNLNMLTYSFLELASPSGSTEMITHVALWFCTSMLIVLKLTLYSLSFNKSHPITEEK